MKRTTINIPDEISLLVEREAHRRKTSVSAVAREALMEHLDMNKKGGRHLPFAGLASSGRRDISQNIEEILNRELDS